MEPLAVPPLLADLAFLKGVFGRQSKLADLFSTSTASVSRWLNKEDTPQPEFAEKILGVSYIVYRLSNLLEPEAVHAWLHGVNDHLHHQKPIDLIRQGRLTDVISALDEYDAGGFA
jgi:hypothetical protein